jgi:uncharacterized protein GlcG (DUF336 family)
MPLSLEHALSLAQAALSRAAARNMAVSVAVIDQSFFLKAGLRADAAGAPTLEIAFGKARAALSFNCSSRQIADALAGNPLAGPSVLAALPGPLVLLPGGALLRDAAGAIIGAIGVAGGAPDEDEWAATGEQHRA